jgi:hypothetical protein
MISRDQIGIVIDEKLVGVWFLATIIGHQDWLAAVSVIEPDVKYKLTYRFRYYKDDKAYDSEDKKNWYEGEVTGTRAYVVASIRSVARELERRADGKLYEIMNESGDMQEFMRKFADMPFAYVRQEKIDDVPTPHPVQD